MPVTRPRNRERLSDGFDTPTKSWETSTADRGPMRNSPLDCCIIDLSFAGQHHAEEACIPNLTLAFSLYLEGHSVDAELI